MGAKAWFMAYFDEDPKTVLAARPQPDRNKSRALAERLLPDLTLTAADDGTLDYLAPDEREVFVGCYGGVSIVAYDGLANDQPSNIDPRWIDPSLGKTAYLHLTHSVSDWFSFALWHEGELIRTLSLSTDDGVFEQIGDPLTFERPYWDGRFAVDDGEGEDEPYPLPFHPLELAEASLLHHLGFQFEGYVKDWVCDPADIPIATFAAAGKRPFWKFW